MVEDNPVAAENPGRVTLGAIITSAVVAAVVAFLLRRALRTDQAETFAATTSTEETEAAPRNQAMAATGEFIRSHLAPDLKPMLLTVMKDVREYVDRGFERAEQSIKDL